MDTFCTYNKKLNQFQWNISYAGTWFIMIINKDIILQNSCTW
jgi:hypothetical protein